MKKILCLILATVFVLAFASCGEPESFDPIKGTESGKGVTAVMSHKEFIAANIDTPVTVETFVQAKQSWWEGKASFYTQAEDGAYFIYQMPCTKEEYDALGAGTKIRVSGKKAEWSGEIEIADATFAVLDGNFAAEPLDVTALLGTDELAAHQNEYVSF
ncbi:MAG: hypothetical protein J5662_07530, partial [Clostridia bacterium]|nr:hypothetical protein [Clostridia bacterium]